MALNLKLQAPPGFPGAVRNTPSFTTYQPDANGFITVTNQVDLDFLVKQGFKVVTLGNQLIAYLTGANFNVTTDQKLIMAIPADGIFRPVRFTVTNASISLTTAAGGFYDAVSKGGNALVANNQSFSALTSSALALDCTTAKAVREAAGTQLYFSLTTAQGAAATADIYVYGDLYTQ